MTPLATPVVRYTIDLANKGRDHLIHVEATFVVSGTTELTVFMPVWTPGSYLIREYAKNIESLSVKLDSNSPSASCTKVRKNAWQLNWTDERNSITIQYQLYAREKSVRTNWIETDFAFFVGAATFITAECFLNSPHEVTLSNLPSACCLDCSLPAQTIPSTSGLGQQVRLVAETFDRLVDSPIVIGHLEVERFLVGGKEHRLVNVGLTDKWNLPIAAEHTQRIVATVQRFWGNVPYDNYTFQNLVLGGYGGLEHDDGCVLMAEPHAMLERGKYLEWLGLVCHEFFHTWNVRRLRPRALMTYDYESEQYLRELWIAEGITSYFDDLLVYRAGLCSESEYLSLLSKTVQNVMNAPGRNVQSLADSSYDTWIKLYRPDENSNNARISYYTKGAVVAWLLDLKLAELSSFQVRLQDVMQNLWSSYCATGYTCGDFELLVAKSVPYDWHAWFECHIRGTTEIDFAGALNFVGLRWKNDSQDERESALKLATQFVEDKLEVKAVQASLGCEMRDASGRAYVAKITRGSAASRAGLQVDDEVVAVDGMRVLTANLPTMLQRHRPQDKVKLTIFRREQMRTLEVELDMNPCEWKLELASDAGLLANENRQRWLSGN